jgi:hypothetical protein
LFEIDIGHRFAKRKYGMLRVVTRTEDALLFAVESDEYDTAAGAHAGCGERVRQFHHRNGSAAVVIGAVIDPVSRPRRLKAEVVIVRGDQHTRILERRVGAAQNPNDVVNLYWRLRGGRDVYGYERLRLARGERREEFGNASIGHVHD